MDPGVTRRRNPADEIHGMRARGKSPGNTNTSARNGFQTVNKLRISKRRLESPRVLFTSSSVYMYIVFVSRINNGLANWWMLDRLGYRGEEGDTDQWVTRGEDCYRFRD